MPTELLCRHMVTRKRNSSQVCGLCSQPHLILYCNTGDTHLSLCLQIMGDAQELLWPKGQCSCQTSCP